MDTLAVLETNMERLWEDFSELYGENHMAPEIVADFCFEPVACNCGPAVDIVRAKDHYRLYVELPGLTDQDFKVEVEDRELVISGRHPETALNDATLVHSERPVGEFKRSFALPLGVDGEHIQATYKNGLLEIKLPRTERTEKHIKVEVH